MSDEKSDWMKSLLSSMVPEGNLEDHYEAIEAIGAILEPLSNAHRIMLLEFFTIMHYQDFREYVEEEGGDFTPTELDRLLVQLIADRVNLGVLPGVLTHPTIMLQVKEL